MKSIIWIKNHYKAILVVFFLVFLGVLTFTIFNKSYIKKIKKILDISAESHKEQISIIEHENKKKQAKEKKIRQKYSLIKKQINKQYLKEKKHIIQKDDKNLMKIIKKYVDEPDKLTKEIAEEYKIEYMENN